MRWAHGDSIIRSTDASKHHFALPYIFWVLFCFIRVFLVERMRQTALRDTHFVACFWFVCVVWSSRYSGCFCAFAFYIFNILTHQIKWSRPRTPPALHRTRYFHITFLHRHGTQHPICCVPSHTFDVDNDWPCAALSPNMLVEHHIIVFGNFSLRYFYSHQR